MIMILMIEWCYIIAQVIVDMFKAALISSVINAKRSADEDLQRC